MTANQYEQQYGMIPDDEVVIPSLAQDSLEHPIVTGHDGFGSHFLLNSGQDQDNGYTQQVRNETVNPCTWTTLILGTDRYMPFIFNIILKYRKQGHHIRNYPILPGRMSRTPKISTAYPAIAILTEDRRS